MPPTPFTCAWPPSFPSVPTSRATRVTSEAKELSWSTIVLMVFLSSRISPCTSTVIFLDRSPLATAVVTSAMLRTWAVRLPAIEFTVSVRSFQVPPTPVTSRLTAELALGAHLVLVDRVAADRRDVLALLGIVHVREARVVELEIRAAELPQPPHLLSVRRGEVGPESVEIRVDRRVDRGPPAAVMDHARRGDRELRRGALDGVAQKYEVVAEDRVRKPERGLDVHAGEHGLEVALV